MSRTHLSWQTLTKIIPQIEVQAIFHYPRRWWRSIYAFALFLLVLNAAEYVLEWARTIYVNVYFRVQLPYVPLLDPYHAIFPNLFIAHLGLLATLLAVRAVTYLTPRIELHDNGLLMVTPLSRRFIPYRALRGVRSAEVTPNGRFVVWVNSTTGLPFQGALAMLLFGRPMWRGFLLTSDLDGFDQVIARVVAELRARYGEDKFPAHFSEEPPGRLLTLLTSPRSAIHELAQAEVIEITPEQAGLYMASASLSLAIPAILAGLIHLQAPIGAAVLFVLAMLEWPLVSLYLSAVPIGELKEMNFQEAIRVYPLTQLPRWAPAIVLTLMVVAGAPAVLVLVAIFGVIAVDGYVVYLLTKEWFAVPFPEALLGIIVTVIYQLIVYEALLILLPK